jgi:hypothetical protein
MEEEFELPVVYKGEQLMLKASLLVTGYTHKFSVDVNGQNIIFEPDEERNYRAVIPYDDINRNKNIDKELLKVIAAAIQEIVI